MKKLTTLLFTFSILCGVTLAQDLGIPGVDFNANTSPVITGEIKNGDALTTLAWTSLASSPNAYSRSCCAFISIGGNDYIYQFGGGSTTQHTQVARYDVAANTWTNTGFAAIPTGISAGTAITIGDKIYVFGGQSTAGLGKTYMYDPVANTWATKANMLTLVTDALVVKFENNNYVYVIGGGDGLFGTTVFSAVQLYNITTDTYTACTSLPAAVTMMGGGILNYTIIATGGWNGTTGSPTTYKGVINPSDPTQITWTTLPDYPAGGVTRMASFPVTLGTYPSAAGIFCTGGAVNGATLTGATHLYNFCTSQWEVLSPSLAQPRSNFKGCGELDNIVYVVAGFTTAGVGTTDKATLTDISGNCYSPIPVELTSFSASISGNVVELLWETASEINNSGFSVERKSADNEFVEIGFVPGFGTTTEPKSYSFTDQDLQNGTYSYRLKQIDFNGTFEYSDVVEVEIITPAKFNLGQNYPNPFNPSTSIKYSIAEASNVRLSVFNTIGEEVAVLVNGFSQAGSFEVTFDASNLSTGVYLYKLQSDNLVQTKKMILLK